MTRQDYRILLASKLVRCSRLAVHSIPEATQNVVFSRFKDSKQNIGSDKDYEWLKNNRATANKNETPSREDWRESSVIKENASLPALTKRNL